MFLSLVLAVFGVVSTCSTSCPKGISVVGGATETNECPVPTTMANFNERLIKHRYSKNSLSIVL